MTPALSRIKGTKPVRWTTILGLVLVPLTVAGVLLWGLWNPSERLDTVTAAVVNKDKPVTVDGQTVPLGRVLAAELIGGDADTNFTWTLTDEGDAEKGLKDGRYATVITIPEGFSAAATSLADGPEKAEAAHIDINESDRGRLIDTALSGIVTQTATTVLNQQLGSQFVGNVFVGMTQLHSGIGEAADGARQLADGGAQLADGAAQLASGTAELSSGVEQLSTGAADLETGAGGLAAGVNQYVGGAQTLASSYAQLGPGASAAASQLKTTIGALGQFQAEVAQPGAELATGLGTAVPAAKALADDIAPLYAECLGSGAAQSFCDAMLTRLTGHATAIGAGIGGAAAGAEGVNTALTNLQANAGGGAAQPGVDPIAQLDQLIAGLGAFGTGLNDFATQGAALGAGASQLAAGTSQLSTGVGALAEGTPALAEGASGLAEGATQSAQGASGLATGLKDAVAEIPNYSKAESEKLAETVVAPVEARGGSDELFNSSGVPLFAGIALWAGALAMFLVLSPLWRRTRDAAQGVGAITLRSALPALALGAIQGAIAGIVLPVALGYSFAQSIGFFGLALLAGVAFSLIVQGLSALLGGFGRFVAFALLVVAFAVGIVSTVPGPLAAIGDASPVGAAFTGFQAIASGSQGAPGAAWTLALWALAGLVLTAFAVVRARRPRG
ncbi:YhgE/Pip domain-containing protein [Leucobacter insecticola]|uniref:YhgE/Pip domain-containing protein n=1 Tax=Leucobacter insecticola TaxID=2714934 RepID=A0A6G8FHA7_9MICO|nr:YhgE/Pip domain-containing protein [Leucobacter insecticola]QIM15659.1 YhgE/Pip domain-containing protein [Leucobacter insecticola]